MSRTGRRRGPPPRTIHCADVRPCQLEARRGWRVAEREQPGLHAVVGLELQRVVVLPGDVQARRPAHQAGRAVRLALFAGGFVLGRVPRLRDLLARGVDRNAAIVAVRRRDHPPAPVLGDDRDPVAGEVDRAPARAGRRGGRRLRARVPVPARRRSGEAGHDEHGDHEQR